MIEARVEHTGSRESDEAVVARVLAGNVDAFEVLMRRHNQRLFRVVRAILRDSTAR